MKHFALISEFIRVANSHQWDSLYEILTPDFHFKSDLNDIKGRNEYIEFERSRSLPIDVTTLNLTENADETEYLHTFHLDYLGENRMNFVTEERIGVKSGLISFSYLKMTASNQNPYH